MRFLFLFLLVSIEASSQNLLIRHINIVDVEKGKILPDQSVLISNHKIVQIAREIKDAKGASIIDGKDKFLMPGLWDMHVHTVGSYKSMLPMFVAFGVTGVREMGTEFTDSMVYLKKMINDGMVIGPSIYGTGPLLDGSPIILKPGLDVNLKTPQDADRVVDSIAAIGVDFLKVYEMLSPEVFLAIANAAKKHHLSFVGHLPIQVDIRTAINAGMKSIEHLNGLEREFSSKADSIRNMETEQVKANATNNGLQLIASIRRKRYLSTTGFYDEQKANEICKLMKSKNVYVTPTLVVLLRFARRDDQAAQKSGVDQYVDPQTKAGWIRQWENLTKDTAFSASETHAQSLLRLTKTIHDHEVSMLAGTDTPNSWVIPGFSLHRELLYLHEAGLSTPDILRMATINPAKFMNKEKETGSISIGKYADLVILDADPLKDISNTQKIDGVILKGKLFSKNDLDLMKQSALSK